MRAPSKKSNILAAILWIISLVLAFRIPPSSNFIWLPDALLLFGFFPLLISVKSPWLWLAFGVIDFIAGCLLLIAKYLPQDEIVRVEHLFRIHFTEMSAHLLSYHPYYVWAIIGILSAIIGLAKILFRLIIWLYSLIAKLKQKQ